MEEKVRQIEEHVNQIAGLEERKVEDLTVPLDLWLDSGLEEGGILIIQRNPNIRRKLAEALTRRRYKVQKVEGAPQALAAFRKASFSLMIVHWGIFQTSGELVGLLRKAFPQTKIIITSPDFAWPSENAAGGQRGMEALQAGAYAYVPENKISRNILTCVETALSSKEKACPVLMSGRSCNLQCVI